MPPFASGFAAHGHALRRHVVPATVCAAVRAEAIALLSRSSWSMRYHINRYGCGQLNPIRAPWRRHMLALPVTAAVKHALHGIAGVVHASGVPSHAQLVELSVVITLSGAAAQHSHTDISPATLDIQLQAPSSPSHGSRTSVAPLVSAWLALQPVTSEMGPTIVVPGSHRRLVKRTIRFHAEALAEKECRERMLCSYDADGYLHPQDDLDGVSASLVGAEDAQVEEARKKMALAKDISRELEEFGTEPEPHELLLGTGDIGVMDCRLLHFGSSRAWTFGEPRVIMNATFDSACTGAMEGFTYHGSKDLPLMTLDELLSSEALSGIVYE